jgi:tetratricopeptide (TPR) repeat protein
VAERFAPWFELDRALGTAYREVLEPDSALRCFDRALSVQELDLGVWLECALASEELGAPERALGYLNGALRQPVVRSWDEERTLGLALLRLGDGRGRPMLEKRLLEVPEDDEVRSVLGRPPLAGSNGE